MMTNHIFIATARNHAEMLYSIQYMLLKQQEMDTERKIGYIPGGK